MKRRDFIRAVGGALVAVPVVGTAVASCADEPGQFPPGSPGGGGDGAGGTGGGVQQFAVMNSDASGHSHSFVVRCLDEGGADVTYTADGAHTHQVTLTEGELVDIFNGGEVTIETSDGHPHTWVIKLPSTACATSTPPGGDGGW